MLSWERLPSRAQTSFPRHLSVNLHRLEISEIIWLIWRVGVVMHHLIPLPYFLLVVPEIHNSFMHILEATSCRTCERSFVNASIKALISLISVLINASLEELFACSANNIISP